MLACGFSHHRVGLAGRERLALSLAEQTQFLSSLSAEACVDEAVLLSTCNRQELYVVTDSSDFVLKRFESLYNNPPEFYAYESRDALLHLMRVSAGLDSMSIGEPQVFGQVKSAYRSACALGTVGQCFRSLFPAVFSAGKRVRRQTGLGVGTMSLAYAVCQLVRQQISSLERCNVLCVGAGETIESLLQHMSDQEKMTCTIANRTFEKAASLAKVYQSETVCWSNLAGALSQADVVITATSSEQPVITQQMVQRACAERASNRPLVLVDLAVPRDIEASVDQFPGVSLYNLDDMQQLLDSNKSSRLEAAKQAEQIIRSESDRFLANRSLQTASGIIQDFRNHGECIRDACLNAALQELDKQADPRAVVTRLAHVLTNKLLHDPTHFLRDALSDQSGLLDSLMPAVLEQQVTDKV